MKELLELDPLAERPDLDFSKGVRGKYARLLRDGSNVAVIDEDLAETYPDSRAVNEALRFLRNAQLAKTPVS